MSEKINEAHVEMIADVLWERYIELSNEDPTLTYAEFMFAVYRLHGWAWQWAEEEQVSAFAAKADELERRR